MALPPSRGKAPNVFIDVADRTGAPSGASGGVAPGPIVISFPATLPLIVQPRWSNGQYYDTLTYSSTSPQTVILINPPGPIPV